ncbi:type II toxin-antitoxin system RelE/ParE family toxin [Vineibacter terrae]|uniref:type II toxin-antitoxin system RelE/ParE family toxin n=1 Tax=Vineibacter terrae TaxID=2586908 RepID=UPI002E366A8C|nr:type II toxin-antitoxin system RelE/ParE family toxin [Vineibacter terrae]HEX2889208.1 type II toxin-antitoxin system RelE/ParE family toxin [Vineibacter terrae]
MRPLQEIPRCARDDSHDSPSTGRPFRIFYAFDPRRSAILLIGGDKTGDGRFYERMIPIADDLYDTYIAEIRKEGLIP